MATLVLVRHGQASVLAEDYDVLSDLGWRQSRALGSYWAETEERFDDVFVGPRRRQRETWQGVSESSAGRSHKWSQEQALEAVDEHQAAEVVQHYRDRFVGDPPVAPEDRTRWYLRAFQQLSRQWVQGELETPDHLESWATFRRRIDGAIEQLATASISGRRQVVFTSGGVVAAAVGRALCLDDVRIMELSWRVRNASISRFLISGDRFSLDTFNETPHLTGRDLLTMI